MKRIILTGAALALLLGGVGQAGATVVYNLPDSTPDAIFQQAGNNVYYYGDDVTLAPGSPQLLHTITLDFTLAPPLSGTAAPYTPDLTLVVLPIDPGTRLPDGPALGSVTLLSNPTFIVGTDQLVTFDFTGQNVVLPTDFAFAYHDSNTDPALLVGAFSAVVGFDPATVGSSTNGFLSAIPNSTNYTWDFADNTQDPPTDQGNLVATIDATSVVPEPGSLTLLGIGASALVGYGWRRRKTAAA